MNTLNTAFMMLFLTRDRGIAMPELTTLDFVLAHYKRMRLPSADMVRQLDVVLRSLRTVIPDANDITLLSIDDVLKWRDWLLAERKVSYATWNNYLRHLKLLVNFGHECRFLPLNINPVAGVKRLQEYHRKPKVLKDDVLTRLVGILKTDSGSKQFSPSWFWLAVVRTLYYTGMRRRQLVNLEWGDIDLQGGVMLLRAESSKTKREWTIPIAPSLFTELEIVKRATEKSLRRRVIPTDQVFCVQRFHDDYKGKVTTEGQVSGFFRRLKDKTGIEVSTHRFRHTLGTKVAATGKIKDLQQLLGHTDVRTTLEYVQADMDVMRDILGVMDII